MKKVSIATDAKRHHRRRKARTYRVQCQGISRGVLVIWDDPRIADNRKEFATHSEAIAWINQQLALSDDSKESA